jgi:Uncharacterised nucleotidyltransferase
MIFPMAETPMQVLLAALGGKTDAEKKELLAQVSDEEWPTVIALARRHGVALLLYHRLKLLSIALPAEMSEALRRASRQAAVRNLDMYRELGMILSRLHERGIPVIVLKGAHLAAVVYDNIALRSMIDLDLLVKSDDLMHAEQEVLALGCEPFDPSRVIGPDNRHFLYLPPRDGFAVEIHWTLFPAEYPFQVEIAGLWARAQPLTLGNVPALGLSLEDLMLYLCLHTADHVYNMRLKMLCDINEVLARYGPEMDWTAMSARARQWGIVRAVYVMLRLARESLEAAVPADWLAALRPAGFDERYLALARERILTQDEDGVLERSSRVMKLWGPQGAGGKLGVVRKRILLSRETMARMYAVPADSWRIWLYYPMRVKDALVHQGATAWRLARGDANMRAVAARTNAATALRDWLLSG